MNREDIMANNNAASDKEKVVTKYDRKMQKRKEAERKEAKRRFITKWVCIAVLAGIILGSGTAIGLKLNSIYNDYIEVDDEHFSEDHLYYQEDGYVGFADYSVVGEEYNETGFAPYAVAIHIVYFDKDDSLRVKHFVSDSNDDISDPAGKFQEALSKLVAWNETKQLDTVAMKEFEDLYHREAYPGLGTVKKLSIMHHLEFIGRYLDKE